MKIISTSVIACILFCVLSCSNSTKEIIVGKWQANDDAHKDWVFEFRKTSDGEKSGSVTFTWKDKAQDGVYMTGDGPRVPASFFPPNNKAFRFVFLISGDELTLTHTDFLGGVKEFTPPLPFHRVNGK